MKIAFPTDDPRGPDSPVYGHFGSAPAFVVADSETGAVVEVVNRDQGHAHGQCQPLAALGGAVVDAIVVGGIGAGALQKLNAAGIRVYRAVEGSVADNLALVGLGRLPELTLEHTCAGHGHADGCGHGH